MDELLDLLEGGTLFQLALALVVVLTVCAMAIQEQEVPPQLWITLSVIVGYFFGTQAVGVVRSTVRKHVANFVRGLHEPGKMLTGFTTLNEELSSGLVRLLERGLVAQGVLVVTVSVTVCYVAASGHVVPKELWAAFGVIVGFFFGTRGTVSVFRMVEEYVESLSEAPHLAQ